MSNLQACCYHSDKLTRGLQVRQIKETNEHSLEKKSVYERLNYEELAQESIPQDKKTLKPFL